jgi:tetratricopeptide (TPR) repeat protein
MKLKTLISLVIAVFFTLSTVAAQTRDAWRSVRTNHLYVIGNADPEKLRQVAVWLEFFHGAFARLVSRNVIDSSVPTTVVVFRDDASFTPFKPIYQGRPANISGYFLPGDDVNYIAISLDPRDRDPYSTAFHEYVHLHIKDNVPGAPLWLNEGLAELYGSLQFSGSDALLGAPLHYYLALLRDEQLLPLKTLFSIGTNSPHYNEQDKTGIFYGQSWALVHYLMLGDRGRQDQFKQFLQHVARGDDPAKAVENSFGMSIATLEEELRSYVRRGNLMAQRIATVDNPQTYGSYTAMQRSSLTEGEANYYLGDLLMHSGRPSEAERYFKHAIAMDPGFTPAHAALGTLYVHQRRYADAKKHLQKATTSPQSHMVHYLYAYVLSREGISADGRVSEYSRENAAAMRDQLLQSIKLAPNYAPAHYLLAVVDFVAGEHVDEALEMAQKAHQLSPSNANYAELVEDIKQFRSGGAAKRERREPIKSAAIAEPAPTGSSRMLGGESVGVAINDGRTIDSSSSMLSVDEVLNKYVQAMGGDAQKAVTSRVTKGTLDVVGVSRGGSFETYSVAPNKTVTIVQAHSVGTFKIGYNGRTGWEQTNNGARLLKGVELIAVQRDADFYSTLKLKTNYPKITMRGKSKIGYRDVYVIDMEPVTGPAERMFLDAENYLPVRINTSRMQRGVSVPVEIYFDDWRDIDGVKVPFSRTQTFPNVTFHLTVKEFTHNVSLEAKMFEPPL